MSVASVTRRSPSSVKICSSKVRTLSKTILVFLTSPPTLKESSSAIDSLSLVSSVDLITSLKEVDNN